MAIRLISDSEKNEKTISGVTFEYRRVPSHVQQRIEHRHTKRGITDQRAVVEDVLAYAITGWRGDMLDVNGNPVAFDPALLKGLPEEAKAELIGELYASEPGSTLGN